MSASKKRGGMPILLLFIFNKVVKNPFFLVSTDRDCTFGKWFDPHFKAVKMPFSGKTHFCTFLAI